MIIAGLTILGFYLAGFLSKKNIHPVGREQLEREVGGR